MSSVPSQSINIQQTFPSLLEFSLFLRVPPAFEVRADDWPSYDEDGIIPFTDFVDNFKSTFADRTPSVFRTPQSITKTVFHKFVGHMVTQTSELIWKTRFSATIAWEQNQGISAKDMTSKYTGPRGDWGQGYGYITRNGFCPCGASLTIHEDRTCPGATKDPRAADGRLLESLLERRKLS
ncbi:hypothetical protein K457DRAFT_1872386 [Linnemannia elongata AG-77]|uniref:Uncharacterized protein n=1 Tax=Linnemannia elongata AG-77 TaxID=1314771 RepID=A0A197K679_9FUNG|nr:hypothetical protein K457DRAFT_1872386 [Linnemannia elongata AG-77]